MSEPSGTQYGGFWVRLLALLADSAIVFLGGAALLVGAAMALGPEGMVPATFAVWVLGLLYWPVMHASRGQATLGKAIIGLKVARFDGRRISILRSLWRELAKIFSAAVLLLGYFMAGLMPRKQGLHDLMAATYVVRDGPARILPALAVAVAGFAVPVVVGPMVGAAAVMSTMTSMAEGLVSEHVPLPLKQISEQLPLKRISEQLPLKQISEQLSLKQIGWPAAPAPKATPKPKPPVPVRTAKAQPPPVEAPQTVAAPKPEPVVIAQAVPLPVAEPAKEKAPPAKPKAAAAKPKAAPEKPKTALAKPKPAVVPPSAPKLASGPRYNDLMTAVLHGDVEGVKELLRLGKWPDKPDRRGATPLMVAAGLGDVRTAEALLRAGANARLAVPVAEERRDGEMILLLKRYSGR